MTSCSPPAVMSHHFGNHPNDAILTMKKTEYDKKKNKNKDEKNVLFAVVKLVHEIVLWLISL